MTDAEIVELYWQRNEDAVKETSAKYQSYLSKIACNILQDTQDSEECVNDTYLAAWNSMPEQRPNVLSTYLGKIARQIAIDVFRKRNSIKRYASEYAVSLSEMADCFADDQTTEQVYDAKRLDAAVHTFIRTLPETARCVFVGRYYFFDSLKQVAAYCGITETNAKSILFRTRRKLKEYLVKEGFEI